MVVKGTAEVAMELGSRPDVVEGLLRRHPGLRPKTMFAGRRIWLPEDIARLREALAARQAAAEAAQRFREVEAGGGTKAE